MCLPLAVVGALERAGHATFGGDKKVFRRASVLSSAKPSNVLRLSLSSRCFLPRFLPLFFRYVGCSTPNKPRLLHRRQFCPLACALRASLLSSLRVPRFPRRRCTNFARMPRETISLCWAASPPVDVVSRLASLASMSSRTNRRHEGASIHARTL